MNSRKQRLAKAGHSKRKAPSDISPSTSLPPLVEGQRLRCFLRVSVSRLLWTVHKPPSATFVRLRWLGETSNGTHFYPRDGSQLSQKSIKTTARFPICCGPKQFTSYLTDMGCIMFEVLTKPNHLPIARAQVAGIPRLSMSNSISGFYTLVSPTSEKMGELQVSLCLEPLTEAYDRSSSCPPTDISIDRAPQDFMSKTVPTEGGKGSTGRNTPRGKDHLYFQNNNQDKVLPEMQVQGNSQTTQPLSSFSGPTSDLLSVILYRGNKLRDAMAVSAVKTDINCAQTLRHAPLPLSRDNILLNTKPPSPSSRTLLQNILQENTNLEPSCAVTAISDQVLDTSIDIDQKAVDLLLGSTSPPLWDDFSALSHPSSLCGESELNDPQYDQSLLENLFYKSPVTDEQPAQQEVQQQKATSSDRDELPLSAHQLNLLSSVQLLRVCIDSLTVPCENSSISSKNVRKGKPPRPMCTKKCTYSVEYVMPQTSVIPHKKAEEVTRAISSKTIGNIVKFGQRSLFPVQLSTAAVKQWLEADLVFKIYLRRSDQMKPMRIGRAVHPLRNLLVSKSLTQSLLLPVSADEGKEAIDIGPLQVTLELVTGKTDSEIPDRTLPQRDTTPWDTLPTPVKAQLGNKKSSTDVSCGPLEVSRSPPQRLKENLSQKEDEIGVLLHTLLMVPDGKDFQCSPLQSPNVYLNCKLFWSDETVRSHVAWGQANPTFKFMQVTPVALTSKLLDRMKNNVMVIEVWQKVGSLREDHLLGLVKLPLHQFYMSFRDVKIAHLLLQAQYPVLGVDCYMPVIDVSSGNCKGTLRVILAMGRSEQITALQSAKGEECHSGGPVVRPVHLLDHQPHSKPREVSKTPNEILREHLFVIKVDKVSGLTPMQSTVWGEADCYIQYNFPCQEGDLTADINLIESTINIKPFRSTTTLCIPDPVFGHNERHVLLTPEDVPIQKILLNALSSQGLGGGGGVQFEVWCRYYYPNVRDQLVAKATLPLSKLCAMVTMQRLHETQMFSLPLIPWSDLDHEPQPSGLLDVCVQYKHRPMRPEGQMGRGAASRVVTLVIQIHRASGLKAAARAVAETNERFSYYTSVGVNSYITAQLSFLPERENRCTRIVARSFSPEFDHHMEMSCDLLLQRSTGETFSLAEQLDQASAIFRVWNRESRKGVETSQPKDVLLGSVKVPLAELIYKRTGISGWFGLYASMQAPSQTQQILVGGVEISISFAHHSDRDRVIKTAQGLGWEMAFTVCEREEDDESWRESLSKISLTISVPRAWIPLHCLLLPGLREMQRSTYCYFRYKFYDQEAFCSHMKHPVVEDTRDESIATVSFEGSTSLELRRTHPLIWYLREEKLEIQTWVSFTKVKTQRPCDTDRLVGSAFLDLSPLTKMSKQKLTLSGVYPMFRRSAADLEGAAVRVHISLVQGPGPRMTARTDTSILEEELLPDEVDDGATLTEKSEQKTRNTDFTTTTQQTETDDADSFPVNITVDKAMNLNLIGCPLTECSEGTPCCCVSYVTSGSAEPVSTAVVLNSDSPEWDHQHECRLSKALLLDPQQSLVFKVWHKGEMERAIGFASVDLTPLLCGLPSVCGWYNITDFSGHCHGQLKVSITPLKGLQDLRVQRRSEDTATNSSGLFQRLPVSYHTTATYNSFPTHISRYPEQKISSPDHTEIFSERSSESDHHFEHMDNVRLYHQTLQEHSATSRDLNPSSSVLFSTLRKKLSELDNLQRYFSCKLSAPTFPPAGSLAANHTQEDSHQLLLRSNMFVGQANNIISGLQAPHLETTHLVSQRTQNPPIDDTTLQTQSTPTPHGTPNSSRKASLLTLTLQAPPLTTGDYVHSIQEPEPDPKNDFTGIAEEEPKQESDTEEREGSDQDSAAQDDDDSEEDEDYEETVVKPRHLNELTSLTDKTSPWTSILSDPDLVSLESVDAEMGHEENEEQPTAQLHREESRGRHNSTRDKPEDSSETEESDSDVESVVTCASLPLEVYEEDEEKEAISEAEEEPNTANSAEESFSTEQEHKKPKLPVLPNMPNYFMLPHQLEASMKAIRLAPTFSQTPIDSGPSAAPARGPRQRPDLSPTSFRKQTDRIARIHDGQRD